MRLILFGVTVAIVAAFLLGRATAGENASATPARHVYIGRLGDVLRVPAAATRCLVSAEGGFPDLFCSRIGGGRYTVSLFPDSILVWRNGNPDKPAFSARWKP
jgi:hypothetical protein